MIVIISSRVEPEREAQPTPNLIQSEQGERERYHTAVTGM